MKRKSMILALALFVAAITGCKKGEDLGDDCENENTSKVAFTNIGSVPLRVKVAETLTPAFEPISPVVDVVLAPGATQTKIINSDRYYVVWYNNCATSCAIQTYYVKTYDICGEYEEKQ